MPSYIGLDPHGKSAGPIAYWDVDNIQGTLDRLVAAGAEKVQGPRDVGGGMLVAQASRRRRQHDRAEEISLAPRG